jgi:hypothetical protein
MTTRRHRLLSALLWLTAFFVTVALAGFQRATGPSYPLRGSITLGDERELSYRLPRSNQGRGPLRIEFPDLGDGSTASLDWRRYPTDDAFQSLAMHPVGDGTVMAEIPLQPAAGKVEYVVRITDSQIVTRVPARETVVARFRAPVPAVILVPHILAMFTSMLFSTRALMEVLRPGRSARALILVTMGLLVVGGLLLGPMVQNAAFGAYWTGWPLGSDLTDNKTLIAFLAWLVPSVAAFRGPRTRLAVVFGWLVMTGVFLVPHSMRGSELDWSDATGESVTAVESHARPSPPR